MRGVYADDYFDYYMITVYSAKNTSEYLYYIEDLLLENECRLEVYFIDVSIDVYKFKNPVTKYINSGFTTLKPSSIVKKNFYFKQIIFDQYLDYFMNTLTTTSYLGYDDYELYEVEKPLDRYEGRNYWDYNAYAKFYIRSSINERYVQRKYMQITEFASNLSTLISSCFIILYNFIGKINYFYAQQQIMKKNYLFKDIMYNDNENKNNTTKKMEKENKEKIFLKKYIQYRKQYSIRKTNNNLFDYSVNMNNKLVRKNTNINGKYKINNIYGSNNNMNIYSKFKNSNNNIFENNIISNNISKNYSINYKK